MGKYAEKKLRIEKGKLRRMLVNWINSGYNRDRKHHEAAIAS